MCVFIIQKTTLGWVVEYPYLAGEVVKVTLGNSCCTLGHL